MKVYQVCEQMIDWDDYPQGTLKFVLTTADRAKADAKVTEPPFNRYGESGPPGHYRQHRWVKVLEVDE